METERKERREKVIHLHQEKLAIILGGWKFGRVLSIPEWEGLPPDTEVMDVAYDWESRGFKVRIVSETFEPVPDGAPTPPLLEAYEVKMRDVDMTAIPGLAVRKLNPKPGDLITLVLPPNASQQEAIEVRNACKELARLFQKTTFLSTPAGAGIRDDTPRAHVAGYVEVTRPCKICGEPCKTPGVDLHAGECLAKHVAALSKARAEIVQTMPLMESGMDELHVPAQGDPYPATEQCTCPTMDLMTQGCKCGAMNKPT